MKVIDLTQKICNDMPVFSEEELPGLKVKKTVNKDGYMLTDINIYSHNGTHMDAPAHVIEGGLTLDKMDIDRFMGSAFVINCTDLISDKDRIITLNHILKYKDKADKAEFILFYTGYSHKWGERGYLFNCPVLSEEASDYIIQSGKKGVGVDLMSLDHMDSETLPIHKKLLKNDILIIENLNNLNEIEGQLVEFAALPLKFENADGAPVRAIARILI